MHGPCTGIVVDSNRTLYFAYVGAVGDLPFQAKLFKQVRNFQCKQCCPFCLATKDDIWDVSDSPSWYTPGVQYTGNQASATSRIPAMGTANMARHDIFHLGHLGIARHFYCSAVILLCTKFNHFPARTRGLPDRLQEAYHSFRDFCKMVGETPLVKVFSKENMHYSSSRYPDSTYKASDSKLIMEWLQFYLDLPWQFDDEGVLQLLLDACSAYNSFHRTCWSADDRRWFTPMEARRASASLDFFLNAYVLLAKWAYRRSLLHFVLVPKLHFLKHLQLELQSCLNSNLQYIPNPATFATPDGEDFVGRMSRPMRVLNSSSSSQRRLEMYKVELKNVWEVA